MIHGVGSGMCVCTMAISHVLLIFLFHCCHVHAVSPIAALYTVHVMYIYSGMQYRVLVV